MFLGLHRTLQHINICRNLTGMGTATLRDLPERLSPDIISIAYIWSLLYTRCDNQQDFVRIDSASYIERLG